jgi:GNAT superfamily N-acetyltransferase
MNDMLIRPIAPADRFEVADLIYSSINSWYDTHGRMFRFSGGPKVTEVFYDVYHDLEPGCAFVSQHPETGRLMGSCYYHPRQHHVSLGIMNVHPNYFGMQVGRRLLQAIIDFTERGGYPALRLTSSAMNLDSFSLYSKAGFVPYCAFQDMFLPVPAEGMTKPPPGVDQIRPATLADVPAMAALEMEVSGITREEDYRYCITNRAGYWHAAVHEDPRGNIDGWIMSCGHPAMNMLGPCVARTEQQTAALLWTELNCHKGRSPLFLVPVERSRLVHQMYGWGAKNCELHFCQVRGKFQPFAGISMPSFLPETG